MHRIPDILKRAGLAGYSYRFDPDRQVHVFSGPETRHGRIHFVVTHRDLAMAGSDYAVAMLLKERRNRFMGVHDAPGS